jgi:hypothetical protein
MEISITVEDSLVCLVTSSTKKDINSIIDEALDQWIKRNVLKCPIDGNYCVSRQCCNNCSKFK